MNDRQMITVIIVLAILYFWNRKKVTNGVTIDAGGVPVPKGPDTGNDVVVPPTDSEGISTIIPRIVVDVEPTELREGVTYGAARKFPKVGENINEAQLTFNDMVFPDGSPRILTHSQLIMMDAGARAPYTSLSVENLADLWRTAPDEIAWVGY